MSDTLFSLATIASAPDLDVGDQNPAVDSLIGFLQRYGYVPKDQLSAGSVVDDDLSDALRRYQRFARLPISGSLDSATRDHMTMARCGLPDFDHRSLSFSTGCAHSGRLLRYRFGSKAPSDVTKVVAEAAIQRALFSWANTNAELTFLEVNSPGDAHIEIDWRQAADPDHSMVGGVLAHADFPPGCSVIVNGLPLPIHFDDEEHTWVNGTASSAFDIETVALHEIGHCLGLYHSAVSSAVMAPSVSSNFTKRNLTNDDVLGVLDLYKPRTWERVGGPAKTVYYGGAGLIATNPANGDLYLWKGAAMQWKKIGGPGAMFSVDGDNIYGLSPSRDAVYRYKGSGTDWESIGGPAQTLYAGEAGLFATNPDNGDIYRWKGTGQNWEKVGGPGATFVVAGADLIGLSPDKSGVYRYKGSGTSWEKIGGPANNLFGGTAGLLATSPNSGDVWLWAGSPNQWRKAGGPGATFAVTDDAMYGLSPSRNAVYRYTGINQSWQWVGGPAADLVSGGPLLVALSPSTMDVWMRA